MSPYIKLDVGGYNPLLGKSYGEIAAESRSMHKSQGFGSAKQRGESFEYFKPLKGDTGNLKDIFDGVDFTWKRVKGGEKIGLLITKIIKDYKVEKPYFSANDLIAVQELFTTHKIEFHQKLLRNTLFNCTGIFQETTAEKPNYAINEKFNIVNQTIVRNGVGLTKNEKPNILQKDTTTFSSNGLSQLYWIVNPIKNNMFQITDKNNIISSDYTITYSLVGINFMKNDKSFKYTQPIQYKWVDPEKGELYRPLIITPPVMLNLTQKSFVFTDDKPKEIKVTVKAGKDNIQTNIKANLSTNWIAEPAEISVTIPKKGEEKTVSFFIKPFNNSNLSVVEGSTINFTAEIDGTEYTKGIKEIKYDHIPVQTWFQEAEAKLVKIEVKKTFTTVGYIHGAGDEVPASLEQMGYKVIMITDEQLQNGNLNEFPAIVLGIRAFNTNEKLQQYKQRIFDYVKEGGNLIVQYNTNSFAGPLKEKLSPVPFKLSRDRVTIEEAPITFLLPEHPALNFPNKITNIDFDGWIQERGIYFATDIDSSFQCPLSMNDPGEKPNKGSLIIAKYGKGNYVYTGLAFFRELPAGVSGAYRLFANILSIKNIQKDGK